MLIDALLPPSPKGVLSCTPVSKIVMKELNVQVCGRAFTALRTVGRNESTIAGPKVRIHNQLAVD